MKLLLIELPGMSAEKLAQALTQVASYAAENSCSCGKTGSEPKKHYRDCWTRGIAPELKLVWELAEKLRARK